MKNLPYDASEDDIAKVFAKCGKASGLGHGTKKGQSLIENPHFHWDLGKPLFSLNRRYIFIQIVVFSIVIFVFGVLDKF